MIVFIDIVLNLSVLLLAALELVDVDLKTLAVNLRVVVDIAVGLDGLDEVLQVAALLEQHSRELLDVRLNGGAVGC